MSLLAALVLGTGCGPGNALSGSIGESYDLDFDYTVVRKQDNNLLVEYIQEFAGARHKLLKIVLKGQLMFDDAGAPIPIEGGVTVTGDQFTQVVDLDRVTGIGSPWPAVDVGTLSLGGCLFEDGGPCGGSLSVLFENGRSLAASFIGHIVEVNTD